MSQNSAIEWTDVTWNPIRGCSRVSEGCRHCYAERVAARFSGPGMAYEGLAAMGQIKPVGVGTDAPRNALFPGEPHWTGKIAVVEKLIEAPLRWRKQGLRVFVNSMSDLFHEGVPDAVLDRIFAVMALRSFEWVRYNSGCPDDDHQDCRCPDGPLQPIITFQILTKRPERMRAYLSDPKTEARVMAEAEHGTSFWFREGTLEQWKWPLPNVWLGVSAEDQPTADARIPELLATPAAVRFVSAEPLLGSVDFSLDGLWNLACPRCKDGSQYEPDTNANGCRVCDGTGKGDEVGLDWVIVGGESGPGARPMHPDWARGIRDQCVAAGVPFFFKQWGEWVVADFEEPLAMATHAREYRQCEGLEMARVGKKRAGRLLDGREWNEMPGTATAPVIVESSP